MSTKPGQAQLPQATVRFETEPGGQTQVDFGRYKYRTPRGLVRRVWAFVMVLGWSRAVYAEFVERHFWPADRLAVERAHLAPLPGPERLAPFLREECRVGRDGYVQWYGSWCGVSRALAGQKVQVQPGADTVEIWAGGRRLVAHPRATRPGQRFTAPGQWDGLPMGDGRPGDHAADGQEASHPHLRQDERTEPYTAD